MKLRLPPSLPGSPPPCRRVEPAADPLLEQLRLRGARHGRWRRDGPPTVARYLAQIGVLGWLIVVPALLGLFAGRWLDRRLGSGLTFAAALLALGIALGMWSGWKWMHAQLRS